MEDSKRAFVRVLAAATHIDARDLLGRLLEDASIDHAVEAELIGRRKHGLQRLGVAAREGVEELEHRDALLVGRGSLVLGQVHARIDVVLNHQLLDRSDRGSRRRRRRNLHDRSRRRGRRRLAAGENGRSEDRGGDSRGERESGGVLTVRHGG